MLAKTHVIIGAAAWIVFSKVTQTPVAALLTVIAAVSSLLPDMDHPKSVFGQIIKPASIIISKIFGHRGITHSFLAVFLVGFCMWKYGGAESQIITAVSIGYLSHLFADFLTPQGVPLIYPLKTKFRFLITFKTGGFGESFIAISAAAFIVYSNIFPEGLDFDQLSQKGFHLIHSI